MITGGRRIRRGTPLLIIELVPGQSLVMIIVAAGAGLTSFLTVLVAVTSTCAPADNGRTSRLHA